jgi:hypothetical protein
MRSVDLSHAQAAPAPHTARLGELMANDVRDTVLAQSLLRILATTAATATAGFACRRPA